MGSLGARGRHGRKRPPALGGALTMLSFSAAKAKALCPHEKLEAASICRLVVAGEEEVGELESQKQVRAGASKCNHLVPAKPCVPAGVWGERHQGLLVRGVGVSVVVLGLCHRGTHGLHC